MKLLICIMFLFSCRSKNSTPAPVPAENWKTEIVNGNMQTFNAGDIEMRSVPEAPIYPVLIGGAPADRADWPASFTTSQGTSRCTGTVLGPQALQLAAHCVGNGKTATITKGSEKYVGKCTHHPKYKNDATADYALCVLDKPIDLPWYEGIIKDPKAIKVGDKILLAGMGCINPGGGGGNDDVFRIGEAPVIRLPGADNDLVTQGNTAICFGDSGGSAFFKDSTGVYRVAAINSRGDIQTTSYLSAVFTPDADSFYAKWVVDNNAMICGVSDAAPKCRGASQPDPSPVPPWCAASLAKVNQCIYGQPRLSLTEPQACRDEYAKIFACQVASEGDGT